MMIFSGTQNSEGKHDRLVVRVSFMIVNDWLDRDWIFNVSSGGALSRRFRTEK